jgi:hypothetical protein
MDIRHLINLIEAAAPQGNPQDLLTLGPLRFDQTDGIGQVPFNGNINYMGFAVLMTPSQFLRLAEQRDFGGWSNLEGIKAAISEGQPIGSPFLQVQFEGAETAVVRQHEGRTRMRAIQDLHGEIPVLAHVFPEQGLRARHITLDMIASFRDMAVPQKETTPVRGPHFEPTVWLQGGWQTLP